MSLTIARVGGPLTIPDGAYCCPRCYGAGMIGGRDEYGDPQTEWSEDCPRCRDWSDPDRPSLGWVLSVHPFERQALRREFGPDAGRPA